MIELSPAFAAALPAAADPFDVIMQLEGDIYRDVARRRTLRFELGGKRYFLKAHYGVGWKEIFKNLLQLKLPVLGARNEWLAIQRLEQLGVATMTLVGYGERGSNPATKQSFVITEALEETASLEDFCGAWEQDPPVTRAGIRLKRELIRRIAGVSRLMHSNGINHRDYYICHFLLDVSADVLTVPPSSIRLSLIDLHRVQLRRHTPERWIVKDIGGLYFSAMRIGLTRRDIYRFMIEYRGKSLRATLAEDARFWSRCRLRAVSLYHSFYHEFPAAD
jgi:heptose I phosphotransferase